MRLETDNARVHCNILSLMNRTAESQTIEMRLEIALKTAMSKVGNPDSVKGLWIYAFPIKSREKNSREIDFEMSFLRPVAGHQFELEYDHDCFIYREDITHPYGEFEPIKDDTEPTAEEKVNEMIMQMFDKKNVVKTVMTLKKWVKTSDKINFTPDQFREEEIQWHLRKRIIDENLWKVSQTKLRMVNSIYNTVNNDLDVSQLQKSLGIVSADEVIVALKTSFKERVIEIERELGHKLCPSTIKMLKQMDVEEFRVSTH